MSIPSLSRPVASTDRESALRALKRLGLRVTASRRHVVECLYEAGRPVTAEEIASGMYGRRPRCDLASVYRNLETLEDAGLARHMHLGHGPGLYAPAAGGEEYVVCERCGRSEVLPPAVLHRIREAVREAAGYVPSFAHLPIPALCAACVQKVPAAAVCAAHEEKSHVRP